MSQGRNMGAVHSAEEEDAAIGVSAEKLRGADAPKGGARVTALPGALRIALAGNPNCGKTTAFNLYTGARQHVGNYPGVTVEKKEGIAHLDFGDVTLIDLPGAYSLTAYSEEELAARMVLSREKPLAVVNVVDASALERSLYLTVQIMEMGVPVAIACNMMDEARRSGLRVDVALLGARLGVPVVETVARTGEGLREVLSEALAFGRKKSVPPRISYGPDLDPALQEMEALLAVAPGLGNACQPRWLAIKILEGDEQVRKEVTAASPELAQKLDALRGKVAAHMKTTLNADPEAVIADYRYGFIRGLLAGGVLSRAHSAQGFHDRMEVTDKLDKLFTNALFGPLIMLGVLYAMFLLTFELGAYPQGWVEDGFAWLGDVLNALLPDGFLKSLLVSGVIAGVGGVVSFVPLIMIMFLFVAFLEDSGYMARIAYMVDRVFRAFGLHGCSVMPYIISGGIAGGCAIPGAMATRTLRSPKEKLATLLTLPYMACGAKLPVFLLAAGIFFPESQAMTMFLLTLSGWVAALLVARLLRSTVVRGEATPFVMELPPYRLPTLRSMVIHCWERTWMYLKKAGTVLVALSILIWAGMTFPTLDPEKAAPYEQTIETLETRIAALPGGENAADAEKTGLEDELASAREDLAAAELRNSYAGRLGTAIEPLTRPLGFDWRTDIALLAGIAAKEAVVATLGTAYSLGEQDPEDAAPLAQRIASDPGWSKATALSLMLFVLLYSPCFVALVVIRQEAGSWGWLVFSIVFNTALAYGVSLAAYQIASRIWA